MHALTKYRIESPPLDTSRFTGLGFKAMVIERKSSADPEEIQVCETSGSTPAEARKKAETIVKALNAMEPANG